MGRGTPALVLFLSLVVAVASLLANQRLPPVGVDYHPDEGVWTAIGKYYFQKAFIDRDLSYESWDIAYSSFGRRNPTLGKYLIGGSLFAHGVVDADTEFPGYEPGFTWAQVEKLRPSPEILSAARAPMAWLGMGSAVLLFLLARELFRSWFIGLAAALAFSCRPLILEASRQVMMEMPTTFLSLAALYLAARWVMREPDDRASSQRESFVAIGAVCGLAFATKLNSLLVPITIGTWLLYVWAVERRWGEGVVGAVRAASLRSLGSKRAEWSSALWREACAADLPATGARSAAILLFIFIASNPLLYHRPFAGTVDIFELGVQVAGYDVPEEQRLDTVGAGVAYTVRMGVSGSAPFNRWLDWHPVDAVLIGLGLMFAMRRCVRAPSGRPSRTGYVAFFLWAAVTFCGVVAWTPFTWSRWLIPLEPLWSVLTALGMAAIVSAAAWVFQNLRSRLEIGAGPIPHAERKKANQE